MTDEKELRDLIAKATILGATITVLNDGDALMNEGRILIASVQVRAGIPGCGPHPMAPIAAAERLRKFIAEAPTTPKLPETCYVYIFSAEPGNRIGIIKRGERGYYQTDFDSETASADIVQQVVRDLNKKLGVDPIEAKAMEIGSMCGWHVPGANAANLRKHVNGAAVRS